MIGRNRRRSETPAMRIAVTSESRARRLTAQADASATPGGRVSGTRMGMLKAISRATISGGMPFRTMSSIKREQRVADQHDDDEQDAADKRQHHLAQQVAVHALYHAA